MAQFNLSTFTIQNNLTRYAIHLHHNQIHTLFDLKPRQDLFLRRVIHKDPASLPGFKSNVLIATIPVTVIALFIALIHEAIEGKMDSELNFTQTGQQLAGSMVMIHGEGKGEGGGVSAPFMLEEQMMEQVLRVQLWTLARMIRGHDLARMKAAAKTPVSGGIERQDFASGTHALALNMPSSSKTVS